MSITELNWFDAIIIGIMALSIIIGFFRGFIREAISTVAWVAGIIVAVRYASELGQFLFGTVIQSASAQYILSFVMILLLFLIVGMIINAVLRTTFERSGISFVNSLFGVLFGAVRGILVAAVVIILVQTTQLQKSDLFQKSQLAPLFQNLIAWIKGNLSEPLQQMSFWVTNDSDNS